MQTLTIALRLVIVLATFAHARAGVSTETAFSGEYIKAIMLKTADWQLANPKHNPLSWTNGTLYAGLFAAWDVTKSQHLHDAMMEIGRKHSWMPYKRWYHADDIAVCQMYADLFRQENKREMIQPTVEVLEKLIANPYPSKGSVDIIKWWWCDALFMAPPTMVKTGLAIGNKEFLSKSDEYFQQCYNLLYDREEHLFARDKNYLARKDGKDRREANGKKIFWSRGNGWVMGGLARVLGELPADYPKRPFYENLFKEMAARIISLQQTDGMWRASLLDPEAYPGGEVSGTGFFCYALAWGINAGVLDAKATLPAVQKAWIGLLKCVSSDGRIGWVQPIGASPRDNFGTESWEVYGTGAFLLAASEIIKLPPSPGPIATPSAGGQPVVGKNKVAKNKAPQTSLNNQAIDGYKGIWFTLGQFNKYGDKYSGGLATYTAKHIPLAIYSPQVRKTFFVYGGIAPGRKSSAEIAQRDYKTSAYGNYLVCMAGCYDHDTNTVSKPTVVHDKNGVFDPHDNPSLAMDEEGYLWVFVSGRGRGRPGFIYKSVKPNDVSAFEMILKDEMTYPQPKYVPGKGFLHLFTKYTGVRLLYFNTSADGRNWTAHRQLAAIKRPEDKKGGHYQISGQLGEKIAFFFNWHPNGNVDKRTNIYYLQSTDFGKTWTKVDGTSVATPVTNVDSPSLVREFFSKGQNVYIKDMAFDKNGNPAALYVSGTGHSPGPENGLKDWQIIHWDGRAWVNHKITTSDHNYDTGSLWISGDKWTVVAPTENSPQKWGGGGEIVMWQSTDNAHTWTRAKQITSNSPRNHNYIRKVVNGVAPFMYFWADGRPDEPSISQMYFGDEEGNVWTLPYDMVDDRTVAPKKWSGNPDRR